MPKAFVDPSRCTRCDDCTAADACSSKAIFRIDLEDPAFVETKHCNGCGDCVKACPPNAILMTEI